MRVRALKIGNALWNTILQYAGLNGMRAAEFIRRACAEKIERDRDVKQLNGEPLVHPVRTRQFKTDDQVWSSILNFALRRGISGCELVRQACREKIERDARGQAMLAAATAISQPAV